MFYKLKEDDAKVKMQRDFFSVCLSASQMDLISRRERLSSVGEE